MARAREALRHQLAIWRLDATEPADSAVLLLSELTTNAVNAKTTTGREIAVRFELTGTVLRLEVSDASDEQPNMRHATADDESGRGLALVEALADEWGVKPRDTVGKIVWATLVLPEGGHVTTVTTATALGRTDAESSVLPCSTAPRSSVKWTRAYGSPVTPGTTATPAGAPGT